MRVHLRHLLLLLVLIVWGTFTLFTFLLHDSVGMGLPDEAALKHRPERDVQTPIRHSDVGGGEGEVKVIEAPARAHYVYGEDVYHEEGGGAAAAHLFPDLMDPYNDRIMDQLEYIPRHLKSPGAVDKAEEKVIFCPQGIPYGTKPGGVQFEQCAISKCTLTRDSAVWDTAHARLFQDSLYGAATIEKPAGQVWILSLLESPLNVKGKDYRGLDPHINWTATYRPDSTIVTPYEKFVPFSNATGQLPQQPSRNYAEGKTDKVAWFVSNCGARNQRLNYAHELAKHIQVDIYGDCGKHRCPRSQFKICEAKLEKNYKFYLSFENSNCEGYITEKLYWNALLHDVIPIVMGAPKEDYLHFAPPHSFIHVEDFQGPAELAHYLHQLDNNDDLYSQYFRWKGTGQFINTKFWCRLCAMLHDVGHDGKATWYNDIGKWWRNVGTCTRDRWDKVNQVIDDWELDAIHLDHNSVVQLLRVTLLLVTAVCGVYVMCMLFQWLWYQDL